jgi:hypothetical protein
MDLPNRFQISSGVSVEHHDVSGLAHLEGAQVVAKS